MLVVGDRHVQGPLVMAWKASEYIHCDNLRHPEETTEPPPGLEFQGACKSTCMVRKDTGQPGSS